MMSIEPDRNLWGYICVLLFGIFAIAGVTTYTTSLSKTKKEEGIAKESRN
jgi:hypothetical protein